MNVHVVDGLPRILPRIDDEPETARRLFAPELGCNVNEFGYQSVIVGRRKVRNVCVVSDGHDEQMFGSLRIDIDDRDDIVVTMHERRRNLSGDDLAENATQLRQPFVNAL